jgi:hypothetical protein
MAINKKTWGSLASIVSGCIILLLATLSFLSVPIATLHELTPYTGSVHESLKILNYTPIWLPMVPVLFALIMRYGGRHGVPTTLGATALVMVIVLILATGFYFEKDENFLAQDIVYQGPCKVENFAVSDKQSGNKLYAMATCANDPFNSFKVWDPNILAYVANHPNELTREYKLSAKNALFLTDDIHDTANDE